MQVSTNALYDIQIKRIHEYKRQHLNLFSIIHRYLEIKNMSPQERKKVSSPMDSHLPLLVSLCGSYSGIIVAAGQSASSSSLQGQSLFVEGCQLALCAQVQCRYHAAGICRGPCLRRQGASLAVSCVDIAMLPMPNSSQGAHLLSKKACANEPLTDTSLDTTSSQC